MPRRCTLRVTLVVLVALAGAHAAHPGGAEAQQERILPALVGGALGLGVGGYVSLGIWAWKAQHGEYLFQVSDALGWEATPVLIGMGTGATVGWISQERLRRAAYWGIGTGLAGTVVGAVVGSNVWRPPEGRWAGGMVGGGAGLLLGAAAGMFWPIDDGDPGEGVPLEIRIPVGF